MSGSRPTNDTFRFPRVSLLVLLLLLAPPAGCAAEHRARQELRTGEPTRAVALFEEAVAAKPDDEQLQAELSEARQKAGAVLAERAAMALEQHDHERAVRLAREASSMDAEHRSFERSIRHRVARHKLDDAERELDDARFAAARNSLARAKDVAHDLVEVDELGHRIDRAEATMLAGDALAFAEAGQFEQAKRAADRAVALSKGDPDHVATLEEVEHRRRIAAFDQIAIRVHRDLAHDRLVAAAAGLHELEALKVRPKTLAELQQRYDNQLAVVQEHLQRAEAARTEGNLGTALSYFKRAEERAVDREDISATREIVDRKHRAEQLVQMAALAASRGEHERATELLSDAYDLHETPQHERLVREAMAARHRSAAHAALGQDDLAEVVYHVERLVRIEADHELGERLPELRTQFADRALLTAAQKHSEGRTDEAIAVLDEAMTLVSDEWLVEQRATLAAERLIQRAVDAERLGRYAEARRLYLQALATGGDREAIVERIEDVKILEEMQRDVQRTEQELRSVNVALNDRDRLIHELERDLDRRRRELNDLEHFARNLEQALQSERSRNRDLSRAVQQLRSENQRLSRQIQRLRRDRDRRRRDR